MIGELKIGKNQVTWIPKSFIRAGFQGKVPFLIGASTVILLHPNATLDDVENSLKIILRDIQHRKMLKKKGVNIYPFE